MSFFSNIFNKNKNTGQERQNKEHLQASAPGGDCDKTKVFALNKKILPLKEAVPAILKVVSGENAGLIVPLNSGRVTIGRMAGNELFLDDASVSRLHAFIVNENGCHVLHDGKSMNGTFLNGQRISQKHLQHGDLIKTGNTVIVYEL